MDAEDEKEMLADVVDVFLAVLEREVTPLRQRLAALELEAEATKQAKPRLRVPAGSEVTP